MIINDHNIGIAGHASQKGLRPVLNGVLFTPKVCVATDSYRLLEVELPDQEELIPELPNTMPAGSSDVSGIVPVSTVQKIKTSKNANLPILENISLDLQEEEAEGQGGRAVLITTDLETLDRVEGRLVDGAFPDYEQIIPKSDPVIKVALTAQYLKDMAQYFEKHAIGGQVVLSLFKGEDGNPAPVLFTNSTEQGQKIRGVVIPCKMLEEEEDPEPEEEAKEEEPEEKE